MSANRGGLLVHYIGSRRSFREIHAPDQSAASTDHQSSIDPSSSFQWPDRLPYQVAILRKLITTGYRNVAVPYDAESLSALFGRKNRKRTEQIEGILETLKGLGQL